MSSATCLAGSCIATSHVTESRHAPGGQQATVISSATVAGKAPPGDKRESGGSTTRVVANVATATTVAAKSRTEALSTIRTEAREKARASAAMAMAEAQSKVAAAPSGWLGRGG